MGCRHAPASRKDSKGRQISRPLDLRGLDRRALLFGGGDHEGPRARLEPARVHVWRVSQLGRASGELACTVGMPCLQGAVRLLDPDGDELEITFRNIRTNTGVREDEVRFEPPAGTTVSRPLEADSPASRSAEGEP